MLVNRGSKFVWISEHAWLWNHVVSFLPPGKSSCVETWLSLPEPTSIPCHLTRWYSITGWQRRRLLRLFLSVVVKIIKQQACLVRLHFFSEELFHLMFFLHLNLECRFWWWLGGRYGCGRSQAHISVVFWTVFMFWIRPFAFYLFQRLGIVTFMVCPLDCNVWKVTPLLTWIPNFRIWVFGLRRLRLLVLLPTVSICPSFFFFAQVRNGWIYTTWEYVILTNIVNLFFFLSRLRRSCDACHWFSPLLLDRRTHAKSSLALLWFW